VYSANNYFQHFEVLKSNRNKRHIYREFFVEGVRNINEAVKNRWQINALIYSGDKVLSDWAADLLKNVPAARFALAASLMEQLSDKEDTSELIAIVRMPEDNLSRIKLVKESIIVVFDRPASKGNLGSIIRSCDAFGAGGLIITGHAVDLYDTETIRASTGSFFKLPVVYVPAITDLEQWLNKARNDFPDLVTAGTSEKGDIDIDRYEFTRPAIILMGNETAGLSRNLLQMSDVLVKIPMAPDTSASSLNVASAASIFLYEINRQRHSSNSKGQNSKP